MNFNEYTAQLKSQYQIIDTVDLDTLPDDFNHAQQSLELVCKKLHKESYRENEKIIFKMTKDFYDDGVLGVRLRMLQSAINQVDISNFFAIVLTTNPDYLRELDQLKTISTDPVPMNIVCVPGEFQRIESKKEKFENYRYGSPVPLKISIDDLTAKEKFLLMDSKVFCIYPWTHLHAYPTGDAYPCCHAEMEVGRVGNCRESTLEEIWHGAEMQQLRQNMLSEIPSKTCQRCYEQEDAGFFSGRQSANKHHGHNIRKIDSAPFEMIYWDIRFSNLCNLRCRSCGHIFSSQWYKDQVKLAGPEWAKKNTVLNIAGKHEQDMWNQLMPHIDYVEQIYFAGGEPLLMHEHYRILEELERRERFDVRLIYNTNFTEVKLKDRLVFDYWKRFNSVSVGASLDAMGPRAEYIRKGTTWHQVVQNRESMLEICPEVDFYISPTLSIMNAWHLPDFHKDWVARGLIRAQDLNVNILQKPEFYRIDIAPSSYKQQLKTRYEQHLDWLRPQDSLKRATVGFESAIKFMMATDNSVLLEKFWQKTQELDSVRNESIFEYIPEIKNLYENPSR
jgi:radical SAM protein with 4Fe4S-binding SPASM domain